MKKLILSFLAASALVLGGMYLVANAAPTSTIVQNLQITGLSGGGTLCLHVLNSGLVQTTSGDCGAGTTTINGVSGPTFTLASSTYIGITASGTTFTFTNLGVTTTGGNWTGTWINATSGTYYPYSNPNGYITSTAGGASSTVLYQGNGILLNTSGTNGYVINLATGTAGYFPFWNAAGNALTPTSSLFFLASTGNVGIGTTNPGYALDVNGKIRIPNNNSYYINNTVGTAVALGSLDTNNIFQIGQGAIQAVAGGGSPTLYVQNNNGNVGIGTTTVNSRLVIQGSGITNASAAETTYNASGTVLTTILNNGNVGIGTTSPSQLLTVGNNNQFTVDSSGNVVSGGNVTVNNQLFTSNGNLTISKYDNGGDTSKITFGKKTSLGGTLTPLMVIQDNGNVGIGTTAPSSTLTVNGSFATGNRNISTSTTLTATSSLVFWIATSSAGTVTLPTIASVAGGTCVTVTDAGGNAGTNAITVAAQGSDKINGLTTTTISTNAMSLSFCSNASNWYIN